MYAIEALHMYTAHMHNANNIDFIMPFPDGDILPKFNEETFKTLPYRKFESWRRSDESKQL
jgi:hypothetical protein